MKQPEREADTPEGRQLIRVGAALVRAAPLVGPAITKHVFVGNAKMCFSFRQLLFYMGSQGPEVPEPLLRKLDDEMVLPAVRAGGHTGLLNSPEALIERVGQWAMVQDAEIVHGSIGDQEFRATWAMLMMKMSVGLLADAAQMSGVGAAFEEVRCLVRLPADPD